MNPLDVKAFLDGLMRRLGLALPTGGEWIDLAVVDQFQGPTLATPWLQVGKIEGTTAAWLTGEVPGPLAAPANWKPENSESMTLWKPGKHGTIEVHRESGAPPIDWREPHYSARTFGNPPGAPESRPDKGQAPPEAEAG
jgi:hypothetical protein